MTREPSEDRLALTRDRILENAVSQFARQGFDGASLRNIADAAGVQHGMVRYIFGTKRQLWRDAISFLYARMDAEWSFASAGIPHEPRAAFTYFVHWYVGYGARHPEHAQMMMQQSVLGGEDLEWAVMTFIRERHERHLPALRALKSSGALPAVDETALLLMLASACQMPFVLAPEIQMARGVDLLDPDEVARYAEAVVATFLRPE